MVVCLFKMLLVYSCFSFFNLQHKFGRNNLKTIKMKTNFLKTSKTLLLVAVMLTLSSVFVNCNKDEDPAETVVVPIQDPLPLFLTASGFNQAVLNWIDGPFFELGYSFIPMVNGTINAIVVKIPAPSIGVRVTIWDKLNGTMLRTESVDVPAADMEVTKQIADLNLVKNREYIISFNTNKYYRRVKTDNSNVIYPFTFGDIQITDVLYGNGTAQTIPSIKQFDRYLGDCSFKFKK